MIQYILNISNDKKNEVVAKMKRKKLELNARRHSIEFKITKMKITRFNLNSCNCHIF